MVGEGVGPGVGWRDGFEVLGRDEEGRDDEGFELVGAQEDGTELGNDVGANVGRALGADGAGKPKLFERYICIVYNSRLLSARSHTISSAIPKSLLVADFKLIPSIRGARMYAGQPP